eukprot:100471_1
MMLNSALQRISKLHRFTFTSIRYSFCSVIQSKNALQCMDTLALQHIHLNKSLKAFDGWLNVMNQSIAPYAVRSDLDHFTNFFTSYMEETHFAMEEQILFPLISDHFLLVPFHGGIYFQSDHDTVRQYINKIKDTLNTTYDIDHILPLVRAFIILSLEHSTKTQKCLYPDIINKVPLSTMEIISQETEILMDQNKVKHKQLLTLAQELCDKYTMYSIAQINGKQEMYNMEDI